MKIKVCGFDPSLTHWGIAQGQLDLTTGFLEDLQLKLIEPDRIKSKQVRQNSMDLHEAEQLADAALKAARTAKAVFVEVPVGSQSARAMASYGVCVGILGALRAEGVSLIEVNPTEVKLGFTGSKNATKREMIDQAVAHYPDAAFPRKSGRVIDKAEHLADAIAVIHAGVNTPLFQNVLRLLQQ